MAIKLCFIVEGGKASMLPTPVLPQIQVFLAVARQRSFTAAGRELGVSPSAVSQAVKQLEEALHVVLFTRTTRSVALTDAGKRLAEGAAPALGQIDAAIAEISAHRGELVGKVRLSVPRHARGDRVGGQPAQGRDRRSVL
jgi:DNA-binding transcriptional LysR family regulator